jgi:osmotically-inducible protein OsmY
VNRHANRLLILSASFVITGCATVIAPLSDRDIDRHHGKRTLGAAIEDQAIEFKARVNLQRNSTVTRDARINTTSWNGQLLLTGQAPSDEARQAAQHIASALRHVQHVHNEIEVSARQRWLARLNDGWITFRVKGRLLFGPDVPGRRIKVVTENGVIYLMGLVNQLEAEQAVQVARKAYGVQKIVKIFEYIE